MTRKKAGLIVVAAAFAVGGWIGYQAREGSRPIATGVAFTLEWKAGVVYVFDTHYRSRQKTALLAFSGDEGSVIEAGGSFDGELKLAVYEATSDRIVTGWSFGRIERATVELHGQEVLPDGDAVRALLRNHEVIVEMAPSGELLALHFDEDAPDVFNGLIEILVAETQLRSPGRSAQRWSAPETSHVGPTTASYHARSEYDHIRVDKERSPYSSFRALPWYRGGGAIDHNYSAAFRIENTRQLSGVEVTEKVELFADGGPALTFGLELRLERVRTERLVARGESVAGLFEGRSRVEPGEAYASKAAVHNALLNRVGEMTFAKLEKLVLAFDAKNLRSDHHELVWRGKGLLHLHPRAARGLGELFAQEELDEAQRGLILELLAGTGHETAQRVMREILETPPARANDVTFSRYVQRLSFVEQPTEDTINFAIRTYDDSAGHGRSATAYVMGALAESLDRQGERASANRLNARLLAELESASDEQSTRSLLMAVGNAKRADNIEVISRWASDANPMVRATTADALFGMQSEEAEKLLVDLLGDAHQQVQRTAIGSLQGYSLSDERRADIANKILDGELAAINYASILSSVRRLPNGELRKRTLEHMLANNPGDNNLSARIRALLESTSDS